MIIRPYKEDDKQRCLEIFESNCPDFFDPNELDQFKFWLDHQVSNIPCYGNSEKDYYSILETKQDGIIGCGGFYFFKDKSVAQLAWGMINRNFHHQGYGTALYNYRRELILKLKPNALISLGTSQHTYAFFEKMGFQITKITEKGYGEFIHKYDMQVIKPN